MTAAAPAPGRARRAYIDWLRGLAVLCMVLWHVVDAWHVPEGRDTRAFAVVVFFAGWAAPMFLFLAGVSLPMAAVSRMAKGFDRTAAARSVMVRGWQVFLLAHLFRLQSFLLSPNAAWNGLLKPDILNVLGLGMVMAALGWERGRTPAARVGWLLVPAVVVAAVLTPWAPSWWWPSLLHPRLEGYMRVVNGNAVFSLFPAVAYVLAGAYVGGILTEWPARSERTFHARSAAVGLCLLAVALGSRFILVPVDVQRWAGPALIVALRIGAMLLMMALLWLGLRGRPADWSRSVIVLGRASLVVYWVHVELAYGNVSYPFHRALPLPGALAGFALMSLMMFALARWWLRRPASVPIVPAHMVAPGPAQRPLELRGLDT